MTTNNVYAQWYLLQDLHTNELGPSINFVLFSNTFIGVKRSGIMKMIEPCKKHFIKK